MIYFKVELSPISRFNEWIISPTDKMAELVCPISGSFSVVFSRILGLSYPDYLRAVRDLYGGRIVGKYHKYPTVYFQTKEKAIELALLLEKNFSFFMKRERDNNDRIIS